MKLPVIFLTLVCAWSTSSGQHALNTSINTESTAAGYEYGCSLLYQMKTDFAGGVFYQSNIQNIVSENGARSYSGLHFQYPVKRASSLALLGTVRIGVANKKFIVAIPGLETRIKITNKIYGSLGMCIRMTYPAITGKINLMFFSYEKKSH